MLKITDKGGMSIMKMLTFTDNHRPVLICYGYLKPFFFRKKQTSDHTQTSSYPGVLLVKSLSLVYYRYFPGI